MHQDNLINDNVKIRTYKLSEIESMSDNQLSELYKILSNGEEIADRFFREKSIINILKFTHKLLFDRINLSTIPLDAFTQILKFNDNDQIQNLCNSSINSKQKCNSKTARLVFIEKIVATGDNLDVSDFSNKDLIKYLTILPYKKDYDILFFGSVPRYLRNRQYWVKFGNQKIYLDKNEINQIVAHSQNEAIVLTNNGGLRIADLRTDQILNEFKMINKQNRIFEPFEFNYKCWAIFKAASNAFIVLTSEDYYYFETNPFYVSTIGVINKIIKLPNDQNLIHDYMAGSYRPIGY